MCEWSSRGEERDLSKKDPMPCVIPLEKLTYFFLFPFLLLLLFPPTTFLNGRSGWEKEDDDDGEEEERQET